MLMQQVAIKAKGIELEFVRGWGSCAASLRHTGERIIPFSRRKFAGKDTTVRMIVGVCHRRVPCELNPDDQNRIKARLR